jgi:hypothetical protein
MRDRCDGRLWLQGHFSGFSTMFLSLSRLWLRAQIFFPFRALSLKKWNSSLRYFSENGGSGHTAL